MLLLTTTPAHLKCSSNSKGCPQGTCETKEKRLTELPYNTLLLDTDPADKCLAFSDRSSACGFAPPSLLAASEKNLKQKRHMLRYCPKPRPDHTDSHLLLLYLGRSLALPLLFTGRRVEARVPPRRDKQQGMLLTSPTIRHLKNNCCFSPLDMAHLARVSSGADILLHAFKIKKLKTCKLVI